MNTYAFSALTTGQIIPFDPTADLLFFDTPGVSAATLAVSAFDATTVQIIAGGKTLLLSGLSLDTVDSWNMMFADGSRLLVGDDSAAAYGTDNSANTLIGDAFDDQLLGLDGNDTLNGGLGNDIINGGVGTDTASYDDAAAGVTVNLTLVGPQNTIGAGSDTLIGIENLTGSAFNDTLTGDAGNNVLEGLAGNDVLDGGAGIDTAAYTMAGSAVTVNLGLVVAQNTRGAGSDTLVNIENLTGSAYHDTLTGNALANVIDGGLGNDIMAGGAGNDTYYVDSLLDQVIEAAAAGTDTVFSSVSLTLAANVENLTLTDPGAGFVLPPYPTGNGTGNTLNNVIQGNSRDNILDGGAGIDTVSYAGAAGSVNVNLGFASPQVTGWGRDTLRNFENIVGGAYDDRLYGDAGNNSLSGGAGNDLLVGGVGNDTLTGGAGVDTASYFNATAGVTVNLTTLVAQNTVGAGTDTLATIENIQGSQFNDTLTGDALNNVLEGMGGNDILNGGAGLLDTASYASAASAVTVSLALTTAQNTLGAGTDTLTGFENLLGSGFNDTLTGDALANRIDGGAGGDTMAGGAGNDTYRVDTGGGLRLSTVGGNQTLVAWVGPSDTVSEAAAAGTDTVETYVSFTLPDNVENLTALEFMNASGWLSSPPLTLTGNALNNLIVDNSGDNIIDGGAGLDTISFAGLPPSNYGVTVIFDDYSHYASGINGYDQLIGIENVIGSSGNDSITVDGQGYLYDGRAGIDTLSYEGLPYIGSSQAGVSVSLGVTTAQNTVGAGLDTILNFENLTGGRGNDTLTGSAVANILSGGLGNDILEGGAGNDVLYGGEASWIGSSTDTGVDTVTYGTATVGVTVNLSLAGGQNTVGAGIDTLYQIDNLSGSAFADVLTGDSAANVLNGLAGNDTLDGGAGDDSLVGGLGNDTLNGGVGVDLADYSATTVTGVVANLATGVVTGGAGTDTLAAIENLKGSALADTLTGDANNNVIEGLAGNDILDGGLGVDTLSYANAASAVTVNLGLTTLQNTGGAGSDTVTNFETLLGSNFNDTLTGSGLNDTIDGGAGNNTLAGGLGNDTLSYESMQRPQGDWDTLFVNLTDGQSQYDTWYDPLYGLTKDTLSGFENVTGSSGDDDLTGDAVANRLMGGGGNDTLTGGAGADFFKFVTTTEGSDAITDFASASDKIEVVSANFGLLPVGALAAANFVAGTAPTAAIPQFLYNGTTGALSFDSDGTGAGAAVQIAQLARITRTLVASDIMVVAA